MGDARPPAFLHSNFFSSLKQVEKRLKLENPSQKSTISSSPLPESSKISSPLYLHLDQPSNNHSSNTLHDSSEPPQAFLSCSPLFPPTQENPPQPNALHHSKTINDTEANSVNDIEQLIRFLGLSHCQEGEEEWAGLELKGGDGSGFGCNSCHCEGGFYEKIVGVKGPKCGKEVERLQGWINYFLNGGGEGSIESFRLAHLLLGKAAFVSEGADHGFVGLEFPSTIGHFLLNDPPPTDSKGNKSFFIFLLRVLNC